MSYKVLFEKDAETDIDEIIAWYEKEQAGLGFSFLFYLGEAVSVISTNPKIYQRIYKDVRRIMLEKFPYSIYFHANESKMEVIVYTVIHQHRNQKVWKRKTSKLR
jgi:plasmid stabilization system protein ParE